MLPAAYLRLICCILVSLSSKPNDDHCCTSSLFQVQEIPRQWYDDSRIIIGPILHITCSPRIKLQEPATITVPISLNGNEIVSTEYENVKVLVKNDDETSDWEEITDQLPRPADFTNGVVTFQAKHFTE